jgi:hypothetical protein
MQIATRGEFWWSPRDPTQGALWGSWIELGERFFEAITAAPVPLDMRALKALKRSPLALDLYAWLGGHPADEIDGGRSPWCDRRQTVRLDADAAAQMPELQSGVERLDLAKGGDGLLLEVADLPIAVSHLLRE